MPQPNPDLLVEPEWLEARLGDPSVRIVDCRITRVPQPSGASLWKSGREDWQEASIPGAHYVHMVEDLCDGNAALPLSLASQETVAALLERIGVSDGTTIVVYGYGGEPMVHRVWWTFKISGATDVRVLDGGFNRWAAQGRPCQPGTESIESGTFSGWRSDKLVADADEVAAGLGDPSTCLIHALTEEQFFGTGGQVYGRPGRIAGSINVPAATLINPQTGRLRPMEDLATIFAAAGLEEPQVIVPYCGGGIAASTVFFALQLLGYDNVRLYDGSLLEWGGDASRPMETGPVRE